MKHLYKLLFITLMLSLSGMEAYAQVPQGFNFQAVATGSDGTPIANQEIGVQIEIVKGTDGGDVVYTESHTVNTNVVGLFQLTIGQGTAAEGNSFASVDWGADNYFVGLGVDLTNTGNFVSLGKTKLLSVPYALLAHDVVNGSGGGEFVTELNLDASTDTAFTVTISGDEGSVNNSAIIGEASTFGSNVGVEGKALSQAGSDAFQVGTYGEVGGEGTGTHIAVFGSAINDEGTGGRRYGLYGQARSEGRENIGGFGIGLGSGDGEIVLRGDEFAGGEFNIGGFNIGMMGFARQNLNGNIGVRGYVYGENGARSNRALQAEARTTADGTNIGLQALVSGSFTENIGIEVDVFDETQAKNRGLMINTGGSSSSNVGVIVNADTAAMLNGSTVINGDLTVNGSINGDFGGSGSVNGAILDSLFFATPPEFEFQKNSVLYPGYQRYTDQDGNFSVLTRGVLQYGNNNNAGVYNWYSKGGMQVASDNYANGEQAAGITPGRLYMDIYQNENFYETIQLGTGTAEEGGRSYFGMSSLAQAQAENGNLFSVGIVNDPNGNDPSGEAAEIFAWGSSSPNIQMGGMQWENTNHAYFQLFGSTQNGNGWYHSNYFAGIASDGTHEWANVSFTKTDVANQTAEETILLNGGSGMITSQGIEINGDLNDDQKFSLNNGSFSGGQNSYTNGFILNHNLSGGSIFEMYSEGTRTVGIFSSGDANFSGTVTQSSDLRLKTNVTTLSNALNNTLALRGVSYTWLDDNKTQETQIGVIAQEVEEIYPEFVRTDDEGMKAVNYSQMVAVLIEAVKELNAKIEVLESENTQFRAQADDIETMKSQINQLMAVISGSQSSDIPHSANK